MCQVAIMEDVVFFVGLSSGSILLGFLTGPK